MRNLPSIEPENIWNHPGLSRFRPISGTVKWAATLLFAGFAATAFAQQSPSDDTHKKPGSGASKDAPAPPADALPSGDPKTGVLTPPNIDPKMAKSVPDVDPGINNPSPGKAPPPADPANPKVQPR